MKRSLLITTLVGAVIVVLIVTGATIWMSAGARSATDRAVEKVSDFYLEELAGRRSQVVSRFLETITEEAERAVLLMKPENLRSRDALREYIGYVKALYGFDVFAVADEDNIVYTEYSTYSGGSRYAFLSGQQAQRKTITTSAVYGAGKEICLSIPVEKLEFMGKKLKTCFVKINMSDIVSMLAFNTEETGTHFSLYYENGENLTGLDFGPIGARGNLLEAMRQQLTNEQWQTLSSQFAEGVSGEAQFTYSGRDQILYYAPIPETGWMITVLIPKNLVYDQIGGIREETMTRSTIQIIATCAALLIFFTVLAVQANRISQAKIEAERKIAVKDALTGVGSKYAFTRKVETVDAEIQKGTVKPFAIVVCDLNGLKQVNDTKGHEAGDAYIREACRLICGMYSHSPVYRIGGDEFVIYLQDADYDRRDELLAELNRTSEANMADGNASVAAGMADYEPGDQSIQDALGRADQRMYEQKRQMKGGR